MIAGVGGDDVLIGLGGDDVLCGGRGQDILRGGPGEDRLYGGADAKVAEDTDYYVYYGDTLDGGPDDDTLVPGGDPRHDGSVDAVTVADATDGVTVDLAAGTIASKNDEEPETDTIDGPIATFTGTAYADTDRRLCRAGEHLRRSRFRLDRRRRRRRLGRRRRPLRGASPTAAPTR